MKNITLTIVLLLNSLFSIAQVLGGYAIYDHLVTAVHPNGCSAGYVTHFPDDSIWVNFNTNDSMTGNFSGPHMNANGDDLLLETGFNLSEYTVSLLLSNGQYSASHNVFISDWVPLSNITWNYIFTTCGTGIQTDVHYIVPLDFNMDFGLSPSDTVTGIKIIFNLPNGDADFAGAYIIKPQKVGIDDLTSDRKLNLFPNPFSDEIYFSVNNNIISEISLYDITFRKIIQQDFTNSVTINTAELEKGIYIYEVKNKNGIVESGRVMKE